MGLFDDLSNALTPHSDKLNRTIDSHGQLLHYRLKRIEEGISALGRPDVGDDYFKFFVNKKFPAGETELFVVGMNEIYPVQYITVNPGAKKPPAFTILSNGTLALAIGKEGVGTETIGGDVVFLPGEKIVINMEEEGTVEFTLGMVRICRTTTQKPVDYGRSEELLAGRNTHDIARDVITTSTTPWEETPPELVDGAGSPIITR